MVAIFFPISAFVTLGLDHSIANMFLIPLGIMFGADVSWGDFIWRNLVPVTIGNVLGGVGGVAWGYGKVFGKREGEGK